ncbi:Gfo/Idh/MocA family oxidoreductase [Phycisphaeraceae bacterium D3-23]
MAIKVGVVGLGMMGWTHLDVYAKMEGVEVVAVADRDKDRLTGKVRPGGNVEGQAQGLFDIAKVKGYEDAADLIDDPEVDVVDVCLPTPAHVPFGLMALDKGKHLLMEKPLARTSDDAQKLVDAAKASDKLAMPAMCMRFWPGWTWLKQAVDQQTYGKVLAANFRRVASHPAGAFYQSGESSGGAALDLHIHDTDFIQHLFGLPKAVTSVGYSKPTDAVDHIITRYHYDDVPMVVAEGGWAMAEGFGFSMRYTVNFEKATATFGEVGDTPLRLIEEGKEPEFIKLDDAMGYELEIAYFMECVKNNTAPERVTMADAANAVKIVEAEVQSVRNGGTVTLA